MKNEKLVPLIKWGVYYLLLIVLYTFQTIPNCFELFGIKPVLILPLAICVCMFEGVMGSAVYCMITGLLWDISSDKVFGFNAVILVIFGTMISLICIYYLRTKLINAVTFCAIVLIAQGLLDYLFYYALWGYDNPVRILTGRILPTALYSFLVMPLFFLLFRPLTAKFHVAVRE